MPEPRVYLTQSADVRLARMLRDYENGNLGGSPPPPVPPPAGVLLGKPTLNVAKGASGTFTVYSGTAKGSEAATSITIEDVYCRSAAITTSQLAYLQCVDTGAEGSTWEAVPVEC